MDEEGVDDIDDIEDAGRGVEASPPEREREGGGGGGVIGDV